MGTFANEPAIQRGDGWVETDATDVTAWTDVYGFTGQVHIGKREDNANFFAGSVDEVRIYDIALSAEGLAGLLGVD